MWITCLILLDLRGSRIVGIKKANFCQQGLKSIGSYSQDFAVKVSFRYWQKKVAAHEEAF